MKEKLQKLKVKLNKKNIIVVGSVAAVFLVALAFFIFMSSDRHNAYSDSEGSSQTLFSSVVSSDDGKSVSFTGNDVITVKAFSSRMFVLTQKLLVSVDSDGEIKYTKVHNYQNPAIEVSGNYGILFNRNSHEYMIFTTKGIIYEGKAEEENDIIAAAINNDGTVALSTKSDTSASRVYLHSRKGERKYIWACGEEYAVTLDVHSNSKKIAVGAIGAKEGEILSKTYLLDIYSDKALCEFSKEGSGITDIKYLGKSIVSVFQKERILYDVKAAKGAPQKSAYVNTAVAFCSDDSGNTAVLTDSISGFDSSSLTVYNSKNQVSLSVNLAGKPGAVVIKGKTAYAICGNTVYEVSSGKIRDSADVDFDARGLVLCSGKIFAYSTGLLREINL